MEKSNFNGGDSAEVEKNNLRRANQDRGGKTLDDVKKKAETVETRGKVSRTPKVNMDDFGDVYPEKEIAEDKKYVDNTEAKIGNDLDEGRRAKMFEQMFVQGVLTGGWLGSPESNGVTAAAASTCKYDDLKNRIDAFSTLYTRSKDGKLHANTIGVDVTISGAQNVIMRKLTHASNDNMKRPFGFTKIKYFTNGRDRYGIENLPRYVIGVSNYDVRDIEQMIRTNRQTGMLDFGLKNAKNIENRFKVLSEMYAENQLYLSKEPKELMTEEERIAYKKLTTMDKRLKQALQVAAKAVALQGHIKGLPEKLEGDKLITVVENKIIERSQNYFKEEQEEMRLRNPNFKEDPNNPHNDTYVQIMTCINKLRK